MLTAKLHMTKHAERLTCIACLPAGIVSKVLAWQHRTNLCIHVSVTDPLLCRNCTMLRVWRGSLLSSC